MDTNPISEEVIKTVALEEGLKAAINLDAMRLAMLNDAVDWLEDLTGLEKTEIRQQLAHKKAGQVRCSLDTIRAVRSLL